MAQHYSDPKREAEAGALEDAREGMEDSEDEDEA